jgi:hypothetical protein
VDAAVSAVKAESQGDWAEGKNAQASLGYFSSGQNVVKTDPGIKKSPNNHILVWAIQVSDVSIPHSNPSEQASATFTSSNVQWFVDATTGTLIFGDDFVPH